MIIGIGIDSVEIERFNTWHTFSHQKLSRIFPEEEISYCLQQPHKSAERFAARFAAREALFKGLCSSFPDIYIPFLTACKAITITKQNGRPIAHINWHSLSIQTSAIIHLSLTHTNTTATAFAIFEKI